MNSLEDKELTAWSLYRYAGGKNRTKKEIIKHILSVNPGLDTIVSPFFGGGSIEMLLASMGVQVYAYDIYRPLADFWEVLQSESGPERLADEIKKHYPLNQADEKVDDEEQAKEAKKTNSDYYKSFLPLMESDDKFTRAWSFYVSIKGSYSGKIGCSTHLSRAEMRPVGIEKVRNYHNPNLKFQWGDCFEVIPRHNEDFLYLDPPYYETVSHYYGKGGELHKSFDHDALAETLRDHKGGFVMSYDNSPPVRKLYKSFSELRTISLVYQMSGTKRFEKKELLIVKQPEVDSVIERNSKLKHIQQAIMF
jgi:DNA adenine methylase